MKLLPLTLILLATVTLSLAYGKNGFRRQNLASRQANNGSKGNRRQGRVVQPPTALKSIAEEEEIRKNCKMMHKSGAVQGGVPSAKASSLNTINRQQIGGMGPGRNRGRPALAEQGGVESIFGGGKRRNGNGGGQGRGGRNRASTSVDQMDESGNNINNSNRQQADNRQRSGRNQGRLAVADQGETNPEVGGKRQNGYGGRRNGPGDGGPQRQRSKGRRTPPSKEDSDENV